MPAMPAPTIATSSPWRAAGMRAEPRRMLDPVVEGEREIRPEKVTGRLSAVSAIWGAWGAVMHVPQ